MRTSICVFSALAFFMTAGAVHSYTPLATPELSPEVVAKIATIEELLSSGKASSQRGEEDLREVICGGVMLEDYSERTNFIMFLEDSTRWIDFSKFEGCLEESSRQFGHDFSFMLDFTQFLHVPHDQRVEIVKTCMEKGKYRLWRGYVLRRSICISAAASEGEIDLLPLARGSYLELSSQTQSRFPWSVVVANFELYQGGLGRQDGRTVAVDRVSAMSTESLYERLVSDPAFKQAVSSLTVAVCDKGWDPKCSQLVKVLDQVKAFYEDYLARSEPTDSAVQEPLWPIEMSHAIGEFYQYEQKVNNGFFE